MFGGSSHSISSSAEASSASSPPSPSSASAPAPVAMTSTNPPASPSASASDANAATAEIASVNATGGTATTASNSTAGPARGDDANNTTTLSDAKKRRSSGMTTKAAALFANARQSLHLSHLSSSSSPSPENHATQHDSAFKKLGKIDPALSVPQGSQNNSAGNSQPGPRSTFRVGVTEDRNKKCRRTMEDTHAFLYNFLNTPAPVLKQQADAVAEGGSPRTATATGNLSPSAASADSTKAVETDNGYFAIFDGHAGTFAADWCGKKLHILLEDAIRSNPNSAIPELLDQTFTTVDQQLQKLPLKNSGCTAICAVLRWEDRIPNPQSATGSTAMAPIAAALAEAATTTTNETKTDSATLSIPASIAALPANINTQTTLPKLQESASRQRVLYTANVGDARIILCRSGKALRLSYDHKGSDENEGRRITNAGGMILNNRVNGVLAVTRALGDAYMKELVTGHPYTTETVIQHEIDEFMILACDGLWDVCNDQDAVDLIRNVQDPQQASKILVDHALSRFSTDNLSCMVVRFDNKRLRELSEPIGVDGDAISKRGTLSEADAIVKEARHSLASIDKTGGLASPRPEDLSKIAEQVREEEATKSPGPELSSGNPV